MPPKRIEDIVREISKTEFIIFAGTGVTSGTGIPMWKELIRQLLQFVPDLSVDIEQISEEQYPEVAQNIYDTMVNDDHKDLYFDTIGNTLKPIKAPYSTHQYDIWLTTNCVVTTNFEKTFCTAYQRKVEAKNPNQDPEPPLINSIPKFE